MIDTKDIRLGNLVLDKHGKPSRVSEIGKTGIKVEGGPGTYRQYAGEFSPIPLTEEWLLVLDFREVSRGDDHVNYFTDDKFGIHLRLEAIDLIECGFYTGNWQQVIHVHQLQNLYYALTGKELNVNIELL